MIIGNGMIASAFRAVDDTDDVIIMASGVSNSAETRKAEFDRESAMIDMLIADNTHRRMIYFSSCALVDRSVDALPYYKHKRLMEQRVAAREGSIVVRLPQIIGRSSNTQTIVNAFVARMTRGESIVIQKQAARYFIDINHVIHFVNSLISADVESTIIDFANPFCYSAEEILLTIAAVIGVDEPCYTLVDGGIAYSLDLSAMTTLIGELGDYGFGQAYLRDSLLRHYSHYPAS